MGTDLFILTLTLQGAAPPGTLSDPCNAGFIGIEWVKEDFTKGELQQSWRTIVLDLQKVPLQGSYSVPAVSPLVFYYNVKVNLNVAEKREVGMLPILFNCGLFYCLWVTYGVT